MISISAQALLHRLTWSFVGVPAGPRCHVFGKFTCDVTGSEADRDLQQPSGDDVMIKIGLTNQEQLDV